MRRAFRSSFFHCLDDPGPAADAAAVEYVEDGLLVVEDGTIKPGKALVLGCGTGTNAVYLASKGFEVTGVSGKMRIQILPPRLM